MNKIWVSHYDQGVSESIHCPDKTVYQLLEEAVLVNPDGIATLFAGARISYRKLGAKIDQFANVLSGLGVKKGDRVAIVLPNIPAYPIAHFAVLKLGGILVPTNPLYVERELASQLNNSGAETVIILDQLYERLSRVRKDTSVKRIILAEVKDFLPMVLGVLYGLKNKSLVQADESKGIYTYRNLMKQSFRSVPAAKINPDETAIFLYTGGTIFVNLLKLIAVPLILASLVTGVSSLSDLRKLSRIGSKTILLYLVTTTISITLGLIIVNVAKPGHQIPHNMRNQLQATYQQDANSQTEAAQKTKQRTILQPLVDMVPENFFQAASLNRNMLQVVFLALLLGIALIQIPHDKALPLLSFFESLNLVIIRLVGLIMLIAPVGVFALIADTITSIAHDNIKQVLELLGALGFYCLTVVMGLTLHALVVYPLLIKTFTTTSIKNFFSSIAPAQLMAFSTSSSAATLPITMECCEKNLGVSEEVSSFVLPLGATINMDGTALYQSVAAVFIAQSLGMGLDLTAQLTIVVTALLASIGSAGVPGAGIIMLIIILEAVGVPSTGIALILGVDRILDMVRTTTNITGDAAVAVIVSRSENQSDTTASQ